MENNSSLPAKASAEDLLNELNPSTTTTPMPLKSPSPLSDGEIIESEPKRGDSPSLDDLNERKKRLLNALDDSTVSITALVKKPLEDDSLIDDIMALQEDSTLDSSGIIDEDGDTSKADTSVLTITDSTPATPGSINKTLLHASIETVYGTPVIKGVSPFCDLPNSDKWREGVTDVMDFENLPESIGKYEKMRTLLGKVRAKVQKIQYEDEDR